MFSTSAPAWAKRSTPTEWSVEVATGQIGLSDAGSPPCSAITSRMAAISTSAGPQVVSCIRMRRGRNGISTSAPAPANGARERPGRPRRRQARSSAWRSRAAPAGTKAAWQGDHQRPRADRRNRCGPFGRASVASKGDAAVDVSPCARSLSACPHIAHENLKVHTVRLPQCVGPFGQCSISGRMRSRLRMVVTRCAPKCLGRLGRAALLEQPEDVEVLTALLAIPVADYHAVIGQAGAGRD